MQCRSLAVGHRKRCDSDLTDLHKMCNATHFLLVIGKDARRLPFTKCPMSLTRCCQLVIGNDVRRLPFTKCAVTHKLLVIGKDVMRLP